MKRGSRASSRRMHSSYYQLQFIYMSSFLRSLIREWSCYCLVLSFFSNSISSTFSPAVLTVPVKSCVHVIRCDVNMWSGVTWSCETRQRRGIWFVNHRICETIIVSWCKIGNKETQWLMMFSFDDQANSKKDSRLVLWTRFFSETREKRT